MGRISSCKKGKGMSCGKKGKQYHLFYNIKAVGKKIKWGRGEGEGNFMEENQDFKNGNEEEYQGNFIHPCEIMIDYKKAPFRCTRPARSSCCSSCSPSGPQGRSPSYTTQ